MSRNASNWFRGEKPDERKQSFQFEPTLPKDATSTNIENIFPNILDLAYLAQLAYESFDASSTTPEFSTEWKRIATAICDDGFRAAAFYCPLTTHLVIAVSGTKKNHGFKTLGKDLMADIRGVVFSKEVSQVFSAILFTQEVLHRFGRSCVSTSITGHSLGGYLVQICTLYADYPGLLLRKAIQDKLQKRISSLMPLSIRNVNDITPFHLHCIAFDSPGCEEIFKEILDYKRVKRYNEDEHERWRRTLDSLDICGMLADSNIVNTSKYHLQRIQLLSIISNPSSQFISSHALQGIIESLNEESLQIEELYETRLFGEHMRGEKEIFLKNWYVGRMDSCRINFLTKQEINFLEKFLEINRCVHPEGIQHNSKFLAKDGDKILQFCTKLEKHKITCDILNGIWIEGKILSFRNPTETISLFEVISGLKIVLAEQPSILDGKLLQGIFTNFGIQVLVKSISREYLQQIPKIRKDVASRLYISKQVHCLHIVAGSIPISLCMGYIAHDLQKVRKTKVMFCDTASIIRWQEALQPEKIFSELDTEVVVVEVESNSDTVLDLFLKMQESAQNSMKLLILVSETWCQCSFVASNNCYEYGNFLLKSLGQKWTWSELDEKSKDVLWNYRLNIYGTNVGVKDIFGGEKKHFERFQQDERVWLELIAYAYTGNTLEVVENQKPLPCYISRQLYNLYLDLDRLQKSPTGVLKGLYLFVSCSKDEVPYVISIISSSNKFRLTLLHNDATKNEFLNTLGAADPSVSSSQWFRFIDSKFVWQASAFTSCPRLLKCGGEMAEAKVFDLESDCLIFADEPGMGKSAFLEQLYYKYKENWRLISEVSYYWPVLVNLNHYEKDLTRKGENWDSLDSICDFFLRHVIKFESDLLRQLFEYNFRTGKNIAFFIDSFDELSNKGQSNVLEMLKTLRQCPSFKFLVATRIHAKDSLEETLCTTAYKFIPLDRFKQVEFLLKRWNLHFQNERRFSIFCQQWKDHKTTLETFANQVLDNIEGVIGTEDSFIGIPLQLVLLEEVQRSGFEKFCEDVSKGELKDSETYLYKFQSKLALYDAFVKKKIDIYISDKNVQSPTEYYGAEDSARGPYQLHSATAMLYLKESMFKDNCEIIVKDVDASEIEKINRTGICEICSTIDGSRSYRFVHETLAEYFAAKYLVSDLKVNRDVVINFLKGHYCEPYFRKVRFFFDSMLFEACKVSSISCLDVLQRSIDEREYLKGEEIRDDNDTPAPRDPLGRTLLHYAAACGCLEDETLWRVVPNKKNLSIQLEDALGATGFSYTILSSSFQNAEYLRNFDDGGFFSLIVSIASHHTKPSNRYFSYHSKLRSLPNTPKFVWSASQYIECQLDEQFHSILPRRWPEEWVWLAFANVFVAPLKCNMQWLISNASHFLESSKLWDYLLPSPEVKRMNHFFGLFKNCKFNVLNATTKLVDSLFEISLLAQVHMTMEQIFELWGEFTDFQRLLVIGPLQRTNYFQFVEGERLCHLQLMKMILQFLQPLYNTPCPLTVFLCCMFHVGVKYCNATLCNDVRELLKETDKDVLLNEVWKWNFLTKIGNEAAAGLKDYRHACVQTIFNGDHETYILKKETNIPQLHISYMRRIILGLEFTRDYETFNTGLLKEIDDVMRSYTSNFDEHDSRFRREEEPEPRFVGRSRSKSWSGVKVGSKSVRSRSWIRNES